MKRLHLIAAPRHPWPFMSPLGTTAPGADLDDEPDDEDESPYCDCDLEFTLQELETNRCQCCGKALLK